jgi:hypothetical protein
MFLNGYIENFEKFLFKKKQVNMLNFGDQIGVQCETLRYGVLCETVCGGIIKLLPYFFMGRGVGRETK